LYINTLHPGEVRTRDLLFWRRPGWPPCHAARATKLFNGFESPPGCM
jgi:hypothetical protein